ncbi:MAG TPA: tyrosine-type recombinase/integrase [Albitalea sp.]|uniref:tyrosine-type recombinase/integrase n=1 Tax=Piscinibacter sp. TaxID=1903157 RepID=UPI002ED6437B
MTGAPDTLSRWVDHGVTPPRRLQPSADGIAGYLAEALGHPVYERWTWKRLVDVYGALPDARRAKPTVCRLLIDAPAVIEVWQRGRLRVLAEDQAPSVAQVVLALLKTHGRRFKASMTPLAPVNDVAVAAPAVDGLPVSVTGWLQRVGRFHNPHADTNTLGAADDHAAVAAFLRERATRSRHTWRAYTAELQRLAHWCTTRGLGPLSDLTRQDLLAYQASLRRPASAPSAETASAAPVLSERSQSRALAVAASLFRYWHDTGYSLGNPAVGLSGGARSRAGFTPKRFVPAALLQACDAWVARSVAMDADLARWRRAAVWTLYRCSGARLCELAWNEAVNLPRLQVDEHGDWLVTVLGKGDKERAIPLPHACDAVLRSYRLARGLPALPNSLEHMPPIHGEKGGHLGARGLYDEVKAVLLAVAAELESADAAGAALLRAVSPHWLRHAYARTLVVDQRVPLPAAQALLGHASVQTTAAYAKTDLSQLREFVEAGFGASAAR